MTFAAKFEASNPDAVEFSLTLSMSLGEWKKLQEQLESEGPNAPACRLRGIIHLMVRKAHLQITKTESDP